MCEVFTEFFDFKYLRILQPNINSTTTLHRHLERQRQRLQLLSSVASSSNTSSARSQIGSPDQLSDPSINLYDLDKSLDCGWVSQFHIFRV